MTEKMGIALDLLIAEGFADEAEEMRKVLKAHKHNATYVKEMEHDARQTEGALPWLIRLAADAGLARYTGPWLKIRAERLRAFMRHEHGLDDRFPCWTCLTACNTVPSLLLITLRNREITPEGGGKALRIWFAACDRCGTVYWDRDEPPP